MAILKITRWYEGQSDNSRVTRPDVFEAESGGGWESRDHMVRTRFADFKHCNSSPGCRRFAYCEVEHGYRTDEPCHGVLKGLTRIEVVEFRAA